VVAVVRDLDAALDRRLKKGLSLLDGDLLAVDCQRDGVHNLPIITDWPLSLNRGRKKAAPEQKSWNRGRNSI
jgi:hypothetical protein